MATASLAQSQSSRADEMFIKEAMEGDLAEVSMGKLAQDKAQSEGAKNFGKMGAGPWRAFAKSPKQGAGARRHSARGA